MRTPVVFVLGVLGAMAGSAWAGPGDAIDSEDRETLTLLDAAHARPCAVKSGLCLLAGPATVATESAPVATAAPTRGAQVVQRFQRAAASGADKAPWAVELSGMLKRAAVAGNTLFVFFDLDDPGALENHQYTALFQTAVKAGSKLAARLTLSPEDGFRAGHTYRLRVAQLLNGREQVLAESDLALR